MELARMTSKGQLTVPLSIRKRLGVASGDQVLFYEKDGKIIISDAGPSALQDAQAAAAENYVYSLDEIRRIAVPIAQKYEIATMRLFGSYARNEATGKSDIDFIIGRGKIRSLLQLGGLQEELSEAFHKQVDVLTEDSLEKEFKNGIQPDEVMLYDNGNA